MKKLILILFLLFLAAPLYAVDYYVNSAGAGGGYGAGDDGNPGTKAEPWLTIAGAMAAEAVVDGDTVYLHGDFTANITHLWLAAINLTADGTVNITGVQNFGTQTGNMTITGITFKTAVNSTYFINANTNVNIEFVNCSFSGEAGSLSLASFLVSGSANRTGNITFTNCDITMNVLTGSFISQTQATVTSDYTFNGGSIHIVPAIVSPNCFYSRGGTSANLTINGVTLTFDADVYWGFKPETNSTGNFTFTNNTMTLYSASIAFASGTQGASVGAVTITGNTIVSGQLYDGATTRYMFNFTDCTGSSLSFQNNDITVGSGAGITGGLMAGIIGYASRTNGATCIIKNNILRHNFNAGTTSQTMIQVGQTGSVVDDNLDNHLSNPEISYNDIYNVGYYYAANNNTHGIFIGPENGGIIKFNVIRGSGLNIVLKGKESPGHTNTGAEVYGNICINTTAHTATQHLTLASVTNPKIYNNIFYSDDNRLKYVVNEAVNTGGGDNSTGVIFRNNIIYVDSVDTDIIYTAANNIMSASHNYYYAADDNYPFHYSNVSKPTWADWIDTVGADSVKLDSVGSANVDPKMVDPANGKFWLAYDSPCIGTGLDVGTYSGLARASYWSGALATTNVPVIDRDTNGAWDMGAFVHQNKFYVKNTAGSAGVNTNAGTQASPLLTIHQVTDHLAINGIGLQAGDTVYLNKGDTFAETLTLPAATNGVSGNLITYSSYGNAAAKPIIDGGATRNSCISLNSASYVTIDGLDLTDSLLYNIVGSANDSSNVTIQNCIVRDGAKYGIGIVGVGEKTDFMISGCTVYGNAGPGIQFNDDSGAGNSTITITKNTIYGNCTTYLAGVENAPLHSTGGIKMFGTDVAGCEISYNDVYDNIPDVKNQGAGHGIWIDTCGAGNIVKYNKIHDNSTSGIYIEKTSSTEVYGNLIYGNMACDVDIFMAGLTVQADVDNTKSANSNLVYNNTIYNNSRYNVLVNVVNSGTTATVNNNIFKNNIIYSVGTQTALKAVNGGDNNGTEGTGNVYTYNDIYSTGTNLVKWGTQVAGFGGSGIVTYATVAAWDAVYSDASDNIETDPKFYDAATGKLYLKNNTSPCIKAGVNLGSTYDMGLSKRSVWPDSVVTRKQDSKWSIGAYAHKKVCLPGSRVLCTLN